MGWQGFQAAFAAWALVGKIMVYKMAGDNCFSGCLLVMRVGSLKVYA